MEANQVRNLFTVLRIVTALLLLGILGYFADWDQIYRLFHTFQLSQLPLVFGLITLSVLVSALKWGILLRAQNNRVGFGSLFRIYLIGLFFNNFLPSSIGGDGIRIVLAGKYCDRTASATASVVMERSVATVSLALLGLGGSVFAKESYPPAVGLLGMLLLVGIIVTAILLTGWVPDFIKRGNGKLGKAWVSFSKSAGGLKRQPRALLVNLLLSLLFQIIVAMVVASIMGGLGLVIPGLFDLFFITAAASVLAMAPVGLNGYGLREGGYIILLRPFGYTVASALTVSVLFGIFVSIFSLTGGILWMLSHPTSKAIRIKEASNE